MLVESQPDLVVTGEARNGREAVSVANQVQPDVILMDIRMPEMDGIAATRAILDTGDPVRIIVLTTFELDEYVLNAITAGASGFLLKDTPPEELLQGIRTVHSGDAVISPSMTRRLLNHVAPIIRSGPPGAESTPNQAMPANASTGGTSAESLLAQLTPREHEVLTLIAQAKSNAEIASELFLSETTVKTHVGHILSKLDARDRVQAVVFAYRAGVITP